MAIDPDHASYYLNAARSEYLYETLTISHSAWDDPIYLVRNRKAGLTATLETAAEVDFVWRPMRISRGSMNDDMDVTMRVEIGDAGTMIPSLIDDIRDDDSFDEAPVAIFRSFRSTDLTQPHEGPISLEVAGMVRNGSGASLDLAAPSLNLNRTGERYSIADHPMIRSFL